MSEEMNMEALLAAEEESIKEINEHDLVEALVVAVNDNEAIVNIKGNKNDVPIAKYELAEPAPESAKDIVKVDDVIEVLVVSKGGENGLVVSKVKADRLASWKELDGIVEKAEKYTEGSIISGTIIKLTDFGAFMEIEPGFDGLIPMGELATKRINRADEAVELNQQVNVKILHIDMKRKRISLSITKANNAEAAE